MDLDLVIQRLKAMATGLRQVGGTADLDAAIDGAPATPAAYVMPLTDDAQPSATTQVLRQTVLHRFAVVLVVNNRRDANGAAALSDLKPLRAALKTSLLGWVPDATTGEAVQYGAGRLLRLDANGRLWWSDEFVYQTYLRA